mmetsp:Transcript_44447/g.43116  ORF Transcript_44447/g.43116 Transcript_44447/m.43116 type:complete len:85 (+) Transcript_44447:984-1238(+)
MGWDDFKERTNTYFTWRMIDRALLAERVEDLFKAAYKAKMQGNEKECKENTTRALRLQGSLTKTQPIEVERRQEEQLSKRGDFF